MLPNVNKRSLASDVAMIRIGEAGRVRCSSPTGSVTSTCGFGSKHRQGGGGSNRALGCLSPVQKSSPQREPSISGFAVERWRGVGGGGGGGGCLVCITPEPLAVSHARPTTKLSSSPAANGRRMAVRSSSTTTSVTPRPDNPVAAQNCQWAGTDSFSNQPMHMVPDSDSDKARHHCWSHSLKRGANRLASCAGHCSSGEKPQEPSRRPASSCEGMAHWTPAPHRPSTGARAVDVDRHHGGRGC